MTYGAPKCNLVAQVAGATPAGFGSLLLSLAAESFGQIDSIKCHG